MITLANDLEQAPPQQLYKQLTAVNRARLQLIRTFIDDILAEQIALINLVEVDQVDNQVQQSEGEGWYELKTINGYGPYIYRRWREGHRLRSEYIGKANS